jgi:uncharacterized protein (TIGR00730 family)
MWRPAPADNGLVRTVCVFCGSSRGRRPEYMDAVMGTARALVARNLRIVYGGGHVGTMGALADAAMAAGGEVTGVIPEDLVEAEVAHRDVEDLRVVGSMHERKALMARLADGFIALPGGLGTLEEFAEVVTWSQLGLHAKPTGLLNVLGYYDPLLRFLDHAAAEGFVRPEHRRLVLADASIDAVLDAMECWRPPPVPRWIDLDR